MIDSILEKAYPGLEILARTEILPTPVALEIAKTYVRENYSSCRCALLFGSYARGEQNLSSDLDLLVILPKFAPGRSSEMVRTICNGIRVEVFLLTEATFMDALRKEKMSGLRIFYSAITEGIALTGSVELIAKLRRSAQTLRPKIIRQPDVNASRAMRAHLTNQLIKLSYAQDHFDRVQYASIIFNSICTAVIKFEAGEVCYFGRLHKRLREHDPAGAAELQAAYLTICLNGDTGDFVNIVAKFLMRLGGVAWLGKPETLEQTSMPRQMGNFAKAALTMLRLRVLALIPGRYTPPA